MTTNKLLVLGLAMSAVSLASCSSSASHRTTSSGSLPATSSAQVAADSKQAAACAALPPWDAALITYPGADPDAPKPTAVELKAWARNAGVPAALRDNLPAVLSEQVQTVAAAVDSASEGHPFDPDDATLTSALTAVDKWGYDSCAFPHVDVAVTNSGLTDLPASVAAGPTSVSFTNTATGEKAGIVLLMIKPKAGKHYDLDKIRSNQLDLRTVGDIVVAAQPDAGSTTGYATIDLQPGAYVLAIPTGIPPHFGAPLAGELHVS